MSQAGVSPVNRRRLVGVVFGLSIGLSMGLAPSPGFAAPGPTATTGPRGDVREHATLEVAPSGQGFSEISIDNALGDVRVVGHDSEAVTLTATKRAPDAATLERLKVSLVPDAAGRLRVVSKVNRDPEARPVARSQVAIDLVIAVPRKARIEARVRRGTLELKNVDGGGELDAASGRILVGNVAGALALHSLEAPVSLNTVFGDISAEAISADLDLVGLSEPRVLASTLRGHIVARRVTSREVRLRSASGNIQFYHDPSRDTGKVYISAIKGNVALWVARGHKVVVRAHGALELPPGVAARTDGATYTLFPAGTGQASVEVSSQQGLIRLAIIDAPQ